MKFHNRHKKNKKNSMRLLVNMTKDQRTSKTYTLSTPIYNY